MRRPLSFKKLDPFDAPIMMTLFEHVYHLEAEAAIATQVGHPSKSPLIHGDNCFPKN